jgi:hypothetical protein
MPTLAKREGEERRGEERRGEERSFNTTCSYFFLPLSFPLLFSVPSLPVSNRHRHAFSLCWTAVSLRREAREKRRQKRKPAKRGQMLARLPLAVTLSLVYRAQAGPVCHTGQEMKRKEKERR